MYLYSILLYSFYYIIHFIILYIFTISFHYLKKIKLIYIQFSILKMGKILIVNKEH